MNDDFVKNPMNEENTEEKAEQAQPAEEQSAETAAPEAQAQSEQPPIYSAPQTAYTPHVTPPSQQYTPPYTANSQQYMPYSGYAQPMKTAEKKPSKGKKKGLIVAALILCVAVLIAVGVMIGSIIMGVARKEPAKGDTETKMNITETPIVSEKADGSYLTAGQVYEKVRESSVGVIAYSGSNQSAASGGSGIVMSKNDKGTGMYVITCAHILNISNPKVYVQTTDGDQYDATIVGIDSKTDVGLLLVNTTELTPAEFADSEKLSVGDTVYAIGNPGGGSQFFGSFTNGMVSAVSRPVDSPVGYSVPCIQHTAAINPGNSGGALVNAFGQIVGMNSQKIVNTSYEGIGFAIPTSIIKEVVDELIEHGAVTSRPVLGIKFAPVSRSQAYSIIAQSNDLPTGTIIIDTIMAGSDLANQGVKEGDMITGVNGKDLEDYEDLLDLVDSGKVGDELELTICRVDSSYKISFFDVKVKLVSESAISNETVEEVPSFPFSFNQNN